MSYLLFKSLHLIAMVAWFAGLFYLIRLFVYHTEAFDKPEQEKEILTAQYHLMESRLYKIICNPAMIITWVFGLAMLYINGLDWLRQNPWMHLKLTLVLLLTAYHHFCPRFIRNLKKGLTPMSPFKWRLYNEIPTLLLVSIVMLAVYKNLSNIINGFIGIIGFAILLFVFAHLYKNKRNTKKA